MAITTLNLRALNRSDTASSGQLVTATSATAMDFQDAAAGGKIGQVISTTKTDTFTMSVSQTWTDITGLTSIGASQLTILLRALAKTSLGYPLKGLDP